MVTAVRVEGGPDVADRHIAEHAEAGDVAVTADIPLAAVLVEKRVIVIDPRGEEHTLESIGERLSIRDVMNGLRTAGVVTGGPPPYDNRDKQAFAAALDRVLTRTVRFGPHNQYRRPGLATVGCAVCGDKIHTRRDGRLGLPQTAVPHIDYPRSWLTSRRSSLNCHRLADSPLGRAR
jgi:uncharacterized protein YaiI (UPF0178 family)